MKIVFATPQSSRGSTMIGRVQPLAAHLARRHQVHVLALQGTAPLPPDLPYTVHIVGAEPFARTTRGKKRLRGLELLANMLTAAWRTAYRLLRLQPDRIIIVKTLPANVLGVWLASLFLPRAKIVVDADDFELTANTLATLSQRAAIHWAERAAVRLADGLVAATPFLTDHLQQLSGLTKHARLIPTGFTPHQNAPSVSSGMTASTPPAYGAGFRSRTESGDAPTVGLGSFPSPVPLPRGQARRTPVLLYIGSVSVSSGHRVDLLPDILAQLKKSRVEARLRIAGDGDDVETLRRAFRANATERIVEWTGRFTLADLPRILRDVQILLDPVDDSIAQRAKSSFRVVLALAAGRPVVTSNIGIRPHLIPDAFHKRFFAAPADAGAYAARIATQLAQPMAAGERDMLQQAAERFTWNTLGKEYEALLRNL